MEDLRNSEDWKENCTTRNHLVCCTLGVIHIEDEKLKQVIGLPSEQTFNWYLWNTKLEEPVSLIFKRKLNQGKSEYFIRGLLEHSNRDGIFYGAAGQLVMTLIWKTTCT